MDRTAEGHTVSTFHAMLAKDKGQVRPYVTIYLLIAEGVTAAWLCIWSGREVIPSSDGDAEYTVLVLA